LRLFLRKIGQSPSPNVLGNFQERLKTGGLLGLIANRPLSGLEKQLRNSGFEVTTDFAPSSEKVEKNPDSLPRSQGATIVANIKNKFSNEISLLPPSSLLFFLSIPLAEK
jgi:hypothetical protein